MKTNYKGFELSATREKCLGGWNQVYVFAYHTKLGEIISNHYDDDDSVLTHMKDLKKDIDEMIADPEGFGLDEEDVEFIEKFYQKK